jgi:hypothetical protein
VANEVDVMNGALGMLGSSLISDLEDIGTPARLCRALWPPVREEMMRAHFWNALTRRVILSPRSDAKPPHTWAEWALLPEDYSRMKSFGRDDCPEDYAVEGRHVLANTKTFTLTYIADRPVAEWDAKMIAVAIALMRRELAYAITKSTSLRDSMAMEAQKVMMSAKSVDGQENPSEPLDLDSPLLESRVSGASWDWRYRRGWR